jgi:hypothetical protein
MQQIPKDIKEGKAVCNTIKSKIDSLDQAIIAAARERAKKHTTNYQFADCGVAHLAEPEPGNPHRWDDIILAWQLCLLFGEYTAGLIGQKSAEGHCQTETHRPCKKMSKRFMETMLADFKKDINKLVQEIGEIERLVRLHTKDFENPSQKVAYNLGLREEPPV